MPHMTSIFLYRIENRNFIVYTFYFIFFVYHPFQPILFFVDFFYNYVIIKLEKVGVHMNLQIDPSWKFKQIIVNIKKIKEDFYAQLSSFSYFKLHDKVLYLQGIKKQIYSLNIENWQCSKIWEYLNDNLELSELNKYL